MIRLIKYEDSVESMEWSLLILLLNSTHQEYQDKKIIHLTWPKPRLYLIASNTQWSDSFKMSIYSGI